MKIADFDYVLPPERIAQTPAPTRDGSRLLVLHRQTGQLEDKMFSEIAGFFRAGDVLVINETKVIPARLLGRKKTGARVELFLLQRIAGDRWKVLARPGRRVRPGDEIVFEEPTLRARICEVASGGARIAEFSYLGIWEEVLDRAGTVPLPPYIKEYNGDIGRYQTVFARIPGSVAAPTAGLHFTEALLSALEEKGVAVAKVRLNVGLRHIPSRRGRKTLKTMRCTANTMKSPRRRPKRSMAPKPPAAGSSPAEPPLPGF